MNIIEAIKSGKPFSRPSSVSYWNWWWRVGGENEAEFVCIEDPRRQESLSVSDILADDWKVKEDQPVTITRQQFWDAYRKCLELTNYGAHPSVEWTIKAVAKKLGLE